MFAVLVALTPVALVGVPERENEQAVASAAVQFSVEVFPVGTVPPPESLFEHDVLLVQAELTPTVIAITNPAAAIEMVEDALNALYPGAVIPRSEEPAYTWIFNEVTEEWELICTDPQTFHIQLATLVAVRVTITVDLDD